MTNCSSWIVCVRYIRPSSFDRAEQALGGGVGILAVGRVLEREERQSGVRRPAKAVQR